MALEKMIELPLRNCDDLRAITQPKLSVISPSLNHAPFLRWMIHSVANQSFRNFEHIIVDGQSKDDSVEILKEYPHLRWVSEKDRDAIEAHTKAIKMSRGEYITQQNVTDGYIDMDWFKVAIETLDRDPEISCVWAIPQQMNEEGALGKVEWPYFFDSPPPQKDGFLTYWLGRIPFLLPEHNAIYRRSVFNDCFPRHDENNPNGFNGHLGFSYRFHTQGYLPYFIPRVVNIGRRHSGQRSEIFIKEEKPMADDYYQSVRKYRQRFLSGQIHHQFRNGNGKVIREVTDKQLNYYRWQIFKYYIINTRLFQTDLCSFQWKLKKKVGQWLQK